jgi:hypothetical protein
VFGRQRFAEAAFAVAQRKAQRLTFRQRRNVLMTDDWMEDALSFAGQVRREFVSAAAC